MGRHLRNIFSDETSCLQARCDRRVAGELVDNIAKDLKPGTLFWRKELLSTNTQGITFSLLLLQLTLFSSSHHCSEQG